MNGMMNAKNSVDKFQEEFDNRYAERLTTVSEIKARVAHLRQGGRWVPSENEPTLPLFSIRFSKELPYSLEVLS